MQKNLEIERLRAVAVLLVMLGHARGISEILPPLLKHTWVGVDLFFVISGYVVSLSLARLLPDLSQPKLKARFRAAGTGLKRFYLRRVHRILPLVTFWFIVSFFLAWHFEGAPGSSLGTPERVFREGLLFLSLLYNYFRPEPSVLGHLWSLSVEEQFYLLLPVLFIAAPNRRSRLAVAFGGVLTVIFIFRPFTPIPIAEDYTSHRRFDQLFLGVLLAMIQLHSLRAGPAERLRPVLLRTLLPSMLIVLLWTTPALLSFETFQRIGYTAIGLVALSLVYLASRQEGFIFGRGLFARVLEYLGSRSYGLYLAHVPVGHFLSTVLSGGAPPLAVYFGASIAAAELTYRFVEEPFIRRGRRVTAA